jgi:hypothetical protein
MRGNALRSWFSALYRSLSSSMYRFFRVFISILADLGMCEWAQCSTAATTASIGRVQARGGKVHAFS